MPMGRAPPQQATALHTNSMMAAKLATGDRRAIAFTNELIAKLTNGGQEVFASAAAFLNYAVIFSNDPRCDAPGTALVFGVAESGDAPAPPGALALGAMRSGGGAPSEDGPMGAEKAERDVAAIMRMSITSIP